MGSKAIVIGSGGHAKVIIDIMMNQNFYEAIACTLEDLNNENVTGVQSPHDDSYLWQLYKQGIRKAFVAIGDNKLRFNVAKYVCELGFELINIVSPSAYLSKKVKLGSGIVIMPGVVINVDTVIGDNVIVNTGASVDHDCIIGESVHIAPGCNIAGKVSVGQGTFLGVGCKVIDKITIGSWAVVGAGTVVVKSLPGYCTAVGVPAKVIKSSNEGE